MELHFHPAICHDQSFNCLNQFYIFRELTKQPLNMLHQLYILTIVLRVYC